MDTRTAKRNVSVLDQPQVTRLLFHPRPEMRTAHKSAPWQDLLIPVEEDVVVGARFHEADKSAPAILFFHGNGEIVADYDELGAVYNRLGIHFLAVDYRGYGRSTGEPTVSAMMRDCHVVFNFAKQWLKEQRNRGPMVVMGRSLGSACALELVSRHKPEIRGLILESGFAFAAPLLNLLGIDPELLGYKEEEGFRNVDKIRGFHGPTLVIHAEFDHIIPFAEGQALFEASPAGEKTLLKIPGANHNDIFLRGVSDYLAGVKNLVEKVVKEEAKG